MTELVASIGEFSLPTRIVFGDGSVERVAELTREIGGTRALVVTDPGIVAAGHVERMEALLRAAGIETRRFDGVHENPTEADVEACRATLGDWPADLLIAIGGGSSIDVAKGCAFVQAGGGRMRDYHGRGKARGRLLPLIAIPTTAGTGSEVQSFALIGNVDTHQKMACGDKQAAPKVAILDPRLTLTQPRFVTACTGLDTLAHAVESAVSRASTAVSAMFSREAFRLVERCLPQVLSNPEQIEPRANMLRASAFAGIAIENSMLGAAHSMANPLTAHFGIAHGAAVGRLLPRVVEYNIADREAAGIYAVLARIARLCWYDEEDTRVAQALVTRLEQLVKAAGFEPRLHEVPASAVDGLAAEAAQQWTAQFNPRPIDETGFRELFRMAMR